MSTVPRTPPAPDKLGQATAVHRRTLTATAIAAALIAGSATATVSGRPASPRSALSPTHIDRVRRPVYASRQG
ncbi:MAG: hypothetical protein ACXVFQ_22925 [Solirubrobacteraceae bacterium]